MEFLAIVVMMIISSTTLNPLHGGWTVLTLESTAMILKKMRIKLMMTRQTAVDLFVWHESLGGGRRATIDVLIRPAAAGGSYSSLSWGSLFQVLVWRFPSGLSPCLALGDSISTPCLGGVFS